MCEHLRKPGQNPRASEVDAPLFIFQINGFKKTILQDEYIGEDCSLRYLMAILLKYYIFFSRTKTDGRRDLAGPSPVRKYCFTDISLYFDHLSISSWISA